MIYPIFAIAILTLAIAITILTPQMRMQTCMIMIAATFAYMSVAQNGDIAIAVLLLVTGILGALALDSFSLQPKVRYGVVMV